MGIFSRLFQRGQDGSSSDAPAGDDHAAAAERAESPERAEATARDDRADRAERAGRDDRRDAGAASSAAPAAPPPEPTSHLAAPSLTPAFATSSAPAAEPARSIWDWPGPTRAAERPAARGAGLPSVPRGTPAQAPSAAAPAASSDAPERASEPAREREPRDPTMVLSPPPAPSPPSARGTAKPSTPPATAPATTKTAPLPAVAPSGRGGGAGSGSAARAPAAAPSPAAASPAPSPSAPAAATSPASPSPAPAPSSPAATPPTAAASGAPEVPPASARPARRAHSDSVSDAFDLAISASGEGSAGAGAPHGVSTEADLAEVRRVFNDVAAVHVAQVRDVMLELRYGEAQPSWIESTQPALRSLRAMAAQMDLTDLCSALDEFCAAVNAAVEGRAQIDDAGKAALLRRYERLIELIPQAFELDAERDRREPLIVEALLLQIEGVERRTIEKLFEVGLHRLDALMRATSEEIAVVAGLRTELANAIADQLATYRAQARAALSAPDPAAERRQLADVLVELTAANTDFAQASAHWTDDAKARKRDARKQRDQLYQRVKVALARLGERDLLARLDKLPFDERIASLDRYLSAAVPPRSQPAQPGKP